jgi:hypothetical protein
MAAPTHRSARPLGRGPEGDDSHNLPSCAIRAQRPLTFRCPDRRPRATPAVSHGALHLRRQRRVPRAATRTQALKRAPGDANLTMSTPSSIRTTRTSWRRAPRPDQMNSSHPHRGRPADRSTAAPALCRVRGAQVGPFTKGDQRACASTRTQGARQGSGDQQRGFVTSERADPRDPAS